MIGMVRFDSKLNPYSDGTMGGLLAVDEEEGKGVATTGHQDHVVVDYRAFELAWYNQRLLRPGRHYYYYFNQQQRQQQ